MLCGFILKLMFCEGLFISWFSMWWGLHCGVAPCVMHDKREQDGIEANSGDSRLSSFCNLHFTACVVDHNKWDS